LEFPKGPKENLSKKHPKNFVQILSKGSKISLFGQRKICPKFFFSKFGPKKKNMKLHFFVLNHCFLFCWKLWTRNILTFWTRNIVQISFFFRKTLDTVGQNNFGHFLEKFFHCPNQEIWKGLLEVQKIWTIGHSKFGPSFRITNQSIYSPLDKYN